MIILDINLRNRYEQDFFTFSTCLLSMNNAKCDPSGRTVDWSSGFILSCLFYLGISVPISTSQSSSEFLLHSLFWQGNVKLDFFTGNMEHTSSKKNLLWTFNMGRRSSSVRPSVYLSIRSFVRLHFRFSDFLFLCRQFETCWPVQSSSVTTSWYLLKHQFAYSFSLWFFDSVSCDLEIGSEFKTWNSVLPHFWACFVI